MNNNHKYVFLAPASDAPKKFTMSFAPCTHLLTLAVTDEQVVASCSEGLAEGCAVDIIVGYWHVLAPRNFHVSTFFFNVTSRWT